ncbi:hypothetical protein PF005_g31849 [Phytophthora fragariae]|uniref:RxLR effector protein n=1 Tax=Phytophthora fragariae TaxID=53985 RepID=A0A6A3FIC9_9STRA|nr:hypothetical protein PF003_g26761 [Phytophthora fragariae]KAE8941558.1 hypothetical protein PF009_g8657 [Phytophthora fragariae]KAE9060999.1 hypothetical protein PF006_g31510 [Phytophthora fragariae]KAE9120661.1 hypothetical protein PF007_g8089 [Phytophthora fragariae]KAE9159946.1 hypothetical protein PF005_g31849 [Phytophthora fragariae]
MRTVFFIAVAVAVFARGSVVAAFTDADESKLLSKTTPDFAVDAMIDSDSRKRFLRVADPEDDDLTLDDEERVRYKSPKRIITALQEQDLHDVANILAKFDEIHAKNVYHANEKLKTALQNKEISAADYQAALALMKLSN